MIPAGNPELSEFAPGAVMRRIADLLPAGGCGINVKRVGQAILIDHVLENILGHSAAADIAVANEKYFYHLFISPFKSCISSQTLDISGFSDF
jgi:hypothetical protein